MNKKDFAPANLEKMISENAFAALAAGKGSRAQGAGVGIEVGNTYKLLGIDYRENLFPPRDMNQEEFNELSEEEKSEKGRLTGWFFFKTNNGELSFGAVLGDIAMQKEDFWDDTAQKAEDFAIDKMFTPSSRTPEAWIKSGCDGLVGKTLQCVATKEFQRGAFDAKARAFVVKD